MSAQVRQSASYTALCGVVMLLYGVYLLQGGWGALLEATALYNAAVTSFKWTLLIGGILLLIASVISFAGHRNGILLDAVVSGASGLMFVLCGGTWMAQGKGLDIQDVVVFFFGLILLREAAGSWRVFHATQPDQPAAQPPAPEAVHPASLHPDSLPADGEPAPPDGYLAALSREKEEPPSASYE